MLLVVLFSPITAVVIAATALGGAMAVPQATKIVRTGRIDGISGVWAAISTTVNAWWGVYAIGVADWAIFPVSAISVTAYLVIAVAVLRHTHRSRLRVAAAMVAASIAIASVPLLALAIGGWVAAGLVLGALYGIQLAPAVVAVYRAHDVSGVSAATWVLAWAEAVLWGVYGFARVDAGIVALAVTGTAMSSLVLVRLFARRPRRSADGIATAFAPA